MKIDHKKGILSLLLLSLIVPAISIFIRFLKTDFTVLQQVYLRVLVALLIGLMIFHRDINYSKLGKISRKEWILLIFRSVSFYLFGVTLFTQAQILTKVSNVSFIRAIPMTALLGFFLLKEKFTLQKGILVVLAFIGVLFISVKDPSHLTSFGIGEICALLSILFMPLSNVLRKWQTSLLNNKEMTQIIFAIAFVAVFVTSLLFGEGLPVSHWDGLILLAILGSGVFNILIILLTNYGYQHIKVVLANNVIATEALFAILVGFILYKEIPALKELIGGLIIVLSLFGMNKMIAKEHAK